jgi:membrane protein
MRSLKVHIEFLRLVLSRARQDGCLQLASSLTLTTLLALVPLLTVMFTLASAFPVFGDLTGQIDDFIASHVLPEQIGKTVLKYVDQFSQRAGRLTLLGLVVLAATSFMTMLTIEKAFNLIWQSSQPRQLLHRIASYWAILTLGPVLIGGSLTMTSYLVSASVGVARSMPTLGVIALWIGPFALTILAFTLLYVIVPATRVSFRHAFIGGLVAGILFELAKRGFALYVSRVPGYAMVYGTFSAFPIFLIWVYVSWLVTLFGATVTASLRDIGLRSRMDVEQAGVRFCDALLVLMAMGNALRNGRTLQVADISAATHAPFRASERLLDSLSTHGWVGRLENGSWALLFDPASIRISDIAKAYLLDTGSLSGEPSFHPLHGLLEKLGSQMDEILQMSLYEIMLDEGGS